MLLGIDPKVDYAFKRVFGDERNADILIHFLNAVLRLPVPIVSIEIHWRSQSTSVPCRSYRC